MSHRLSSKAGSAWSKLSSDVSCRTHRCLSRSSQSGQAADSYHDGGGDQRPSGLPGLPRELVGRANLASKTISTPVGDLPMSPLMDPTFHEARMRYKLAKAPESSVYKKSKWRRQLDRNPWAHALASDIRRCPATSTVIPKHFLQDFNLTSHPETGKPWYVPTSLAPPRAPPSSEPRPNRDEKVGDKQQQPSDPTSNLSRFDAVSATGHPPRTEKPAGPTSYMLARQDLIACQGVKRGHSHANGYRKLIALNHSASKFSSVLKHVVWREDMGYLVLELMRRRIVETLVYFSRLSEDTTRDSYVVRCDTWDAIRDERYNGQRGCVLWLGEGEDRPGPRAVMDIPGVRFGRKIPVHNMRALLGPEHIARLKEETGVFRDGSLFMVVRKRTLDLQLRLWKLQGYLAHPYIPVGKTRADNMDQQLERHAEE